MGTVHATDVRPTRTTRRRAHVGAAALLATVLWQLVPTQATALGTASRVLGDCGVVGTSSVMGARTTRASTCSGLTQISVRSRFCNVHNNCIFGQWSLTTGTTVATSPVPPSPQLRFDGGQHRVCNAAGCLTFST